MIDLLLNSTDILCINDRNINLLSLNKAKSKKIADDKILTKKILSMHNIQTPRLIAKIKDLKDLENFDFTKVPESVVLKPRKGFGGEGILVFFSKDKYDNWVKADKTRYSEYDLKQHIRSILEGNFSLGNTPDMAFLEERVTVIPELKDYVYRGVPDIRIIVYNKVPIMAMLRLPTKESDGKANLHAGGIAVGLDLINGITNTAIHYDKFIYNHPDTGVSLKGIKIPFWKDILELAVRSQIASGLVYAGIDIVIDKIKGPLVLELNARPGLSIQIANLEGLRSRINRVLGLNITDYNKGIQIAKSLFGNTIETEVNDLFGKKLIGIFETVVLRRLESRNSVETIAKIDTGAWRSSISEELARDLGFADLVDAFNRFKGLNTALTIEEARRLRIKAMKVFDDFYELKSISLTKQSTGFEIRPIVRLFLVIGNLRIRASFTITKRENLKYHLIIGRNVLRKYFIVDPKRKFVLSPTLYIKKN